MPLATTHKEYILEQIMLEYLHDGEIPTSDQLETDLAAYIEEHPNLEEPTSKGLDWSVEPGDDSSASDIHGIADTVSQDMGIITREIYRIAQESSRFYDRWSLEMKRLSSYARKLEQRADALLLLNKETVGFFAYVGDVFADMASVDTDQTDARVDLRETTVTINPPHNELSSTGTLVDLSDITENDVSFAPLNTRPGVAYMTTGDGNKLSNVFKTDNSTWVGRVVSDSTGDMVCELKCQLSSVDTFNVSKVSFEFLGPLGTTGSTVTCMYSLDGYRWSLVPSVDSTKTLTRNIAWNFVLTDMNWIKFIFRKTAPDTVNNEYIYSISHINLHGNNYDTDIGKTFVSASLQALDAENNSVLFSLLALDACQELPDNTGIDYSVSASRDDITWTDWINIAPVDSAEILHPKIINLSGADWKDNTDNSTVSLLNDTVTSEDVSQMKIIEAFSSTTLTLQGYRFKDTSFGAVNTALSISTGEDPDIIGKSIVVWRNTRYKDITNYPDVSTVRSNPRGWGIEGSDYVCYFEVIDSNGIILDFGDRTCVIDGAAVSGVVTVPSGIHKFSTHADNWYDIANDLVDGGYTGTTHISKEEELKSIDPLYPHNHKLIIEGFPYVTNFKGEKTYTGTDISAEFYATRASLFDLENNLDTYGYFSVRGVGDVTDPTLAVVVHFDASNPDYSDELFTIKWRSGATNASMYKYAKLRAVLWTTDSGVSPSLTSYRLKLGV